MDTQSAKGKLIHFPFQICMRYGNLSAHGHGGVGGAGTLRLTGDATADPLLHGSGVGWRGISPSPCRVSNPRRVGLDEIAMGSRGAGTLPCRAGGGWVPRGRHAPSALPQHTTGCRVDGVWGERKSPHWCGKARCRFPRHGQRDATGERSGLPCQDARGTTTHILRVALAPFQLP